MKTLALSEIVGLRVKCSVCKNVEEFLVDDLNAVGTHPCPGPADKHSVSPVLEAIFREDVATIVTAIKARSHGRFELTFLQRQPLTLCARITSII